MKSSIIFPFVLLILCINFCCCQSEKRDKHAALVDIVGDSALTYSHISEVSIDNLGNQYYRFRFNSNLYEEFAANATESIFIPLFSSFDNFQIVKSPSTELGIYDICFPLCDGDSSYRNEILNAEIFTVEAEKGQFYYVAGIDREHLDSAVKKTYRDTPYFAYPFDIKFEFEAFRPAGAGKIEFFPGSHRKNTSVIISTDQNSRLKRPVIYDSKTEIGKLIELSPDTNIRRRHTYYYETAFEPNTQITFDLTQKKIKTSGQVVRAIAVVFLCVAMSFSLWEYMKQRKKFKDIERDFNMIFNDKEYLISEPEIAYRREYFQSRLPRTPAWQQRLANRAKADYLKNRIRALFFPFLIYIGLLLALILLSIESFGQGKTIIHNLSIDFSLEYNEKNICEMTSDFKFLFCSQKFRSSVPDTTFIFFPGRENKINYDKVSYEPGEVECRRLNYSDSVGICIINSFPKIVSRQFINLLTNPSDTRKIIKSTETLNDEGKYILLKVPFEKYTVQKATGNIRRVLGLQLHSFPYDEDTICIPISFKHNSFLSEITVSKTNRFTGVPHINLTGFELIEKDGGYSFVSSKPMRVEPNQRVEVGMVLKRSATSRILIPGLVCAIVAVFYFVFAFRGWRRWIRLLSGLSVHSILIFIYYRSVDDIYKGIPHFLEFQDTLNWYDVIFGGGILLILIAGAIGRRKR